MARRSLIDEKLSEWTAGLDNLSSRIKVFENIRGLIEVLNPWLDGIRLL